MGGRHPERRAEAKRDRCKRHTKTDRLKKGNKNTWRGARVQSKPTHKTKSKRTGTDAKRSKHRRRRAETYRNRLEKLAKTGKPKEKSRHTVRRVGMWKQTSSKRRAPTPGGERR